MEQYKPLDSRRNIIIPGDKVATIQFCIKHFIKLANDAIEHHGFFSVALSGGSTPKALYEGLVSQEIDWSRVLLFWSDERAVLPENPESNYHMAMDAGFNKLPIPQNHIFRMRAESRIEENAREYESMIKKTLPEGIFDLVMLGVGDDGHTASLFPGTAGLTTKQRLVIANYVPQLSTWRMTLTFDCINSARNIAIYATGKNKAAMVARILSSGEEKPANLPAACVGTPSNKALWILDDPASSEFVSLGGSTLFP